MKPARIKPFLILSHGLESGPDATKVTALAKASEAIGFRSVRPDYRDIDAKRSVKKIDERIARLVQHAPADTAVVLAGSSMGAFISALASLEVRCVGLFLIAMPVMIPGYSRRAEAARVPTALIHGWEDEICPAEDVLAFGRARGNAVTLVRDDHRLSHHVDFVADQFRLFLGQYV